jgi:hypothetical protein
LKSTFPEALAGKFAAKSRISALDSWAEIRAGGSTTIEHATHRSVLAGRMA